MPRFVKKSRKPDNRVADEDDDEDREMPGEVVDYPNPDEEAEPAVENILPHDNGAQDNNGQQ
ncbi:hypothetical protein BGX29_002904, partial [Mortierella sp. GBA35]